MKDFDIKMIDEMLSSKNAFSSAEAMQIMVYISKMLQSDSLNKELLERFLIVSSKPKFLKALGETERNDWAELCFLIIQKIDFRLLDLLRMRSEEHPDKSLFTTISSGGTFQEYSYEYIYRFIRELATVFYQSADIPRVAIFCENSLESASADLACLCYDILNTPLSVHFDNEILAYILELMNINIVVTDSEKRYAQLIDLRDKSQVQFAILLIDNKINIKNSIDKYLIPEAKSLTIGEIENTLSTRTRFALNEVNTLMFTSGSTGKPKGVSFTSYNIISKRFARGAALPEIGDDESMLCYLPLFHTFGRYLEMTGTIYWSGTYYFAGNSSAETLFELFPKINPSIFISIPLRWFQLYERIIENLSIDDDPKSMLRGVVGGRLKWGLSAAGYLDPQVFKFFEKWGVAISSGFGMTEATGGITMTLPNNYIENTNGKALPGIYLKQNELGELLMRGHYVTRYCEDAMPGEIIPYPISDEQDRWIATGDIFKLWDNGYYEIVDRVKDIYKNNKGQTIAPLKVENKFIGTPGIKRVFLLGDGKAYNVLFIVPDSEEEMMKNLQDNMQEYFHQLIVAANMTLANYERVVNFHLLDRDFTTDNGEITPKGTLNRKQIEKNFADTVTKCYQSDTKVFEFANFTVSIPRWFYRDLGVLETDIIQTESGLYNLETKKELKINRIYSKNHYIVGDLEYCINDSHIDLGIFARQPKLWAANPELINFSPLKDGWDISLKNVSAQVFLPWTCSIDGISEIGEQLNGIKDKYLTDANRLAISAIFSSGDVQIDAIESLRIKLRKSDQRISFVVRQRLETLSRHFDEEIRCLAYRILLTEEPIIHNGNYLPSFLESGLSFLNKESIEIIASGNLEKRRLQALRIRLYEYRKKLSWPANFVTRQQFVSVFKLLVNFAEQHPKFYNSVRVELSNWVLFREDNELSKIAFELLKDLSNNYEKRLEDSSELITKQEWLSKCIYDDGLSPNDIDKLNNILFNTTFLKQSVLLAFDEDEFCLKRLASGSIWLTKLKSVQANTIYRISINAENQKHYDLQVTVGEDLRMSAKNDTIYHLVAISGYPFGPRVFPKLGCSRPELSARSMVYHGDLTVWEQIRSLSSEQNRINSVAVQSQLRKLFITAFTTYFRAWKSGEYRIVPGLITPTNVITPSLDFAEGGVIVSIAGWSEYIDTLSIVQAMIKNFYQKTAFHYPWLKAYLDVRWIFDACNEALGESEGFKFLSELQSDLRHSDYIKLEDCKIDEILIKYLNEYSNSLYVPLSICNAIDKYNEWRSNTPSSGNKAKEETAKELFKLFKLNIHSELLRLYYYRHTYFADIEEGTIKLFDKFLDKYTANRSKSAIQFIELSELQSAFADEAHRIFLNKLVFPTGEMQSEFELEQLGNLDTDALIVKTFVRDKFNIEYAIRSVISPAELGHLYRLYFKQNIAINIKSNDKYFVVLDAGDRVIGGIRYNEEEDGVVQLESFIVDIQYKNRGIGSALLNDFCQRMENSGAKLIKTHYYIENYFKKFNFKENNDWGALVKILI